MQLKKSLMLVTRILSGAFAVIYPFVVFYALQQNVAFKFIGLILLLMVAFYFIINKNKILFVLGLILCFCIISFNQEIFLKLYPVLMNISICAIFALSLLKTPVITQFAQKMHKRQLNQKEKIYTRHVTVAWAVFMLCNTIISLVTVFLSNKIWVLYNGLISYILIGLMMLTEYIIRKKKEKCLRQ